MGGVDVPGTPVGVVVTVGAGTEGALSPQWCGLPVVIVVAKDLILYYADVNEVRRQAQLIYLWQTQVNIGMAADMYYGGSLAAWKQTRG